MRQTTLSAYAHQDLPFEMLVEKLQPDRDLSRNPLVQVMFSLQNAPQSAADLSGLTIQSLPLPLDITVRFDLEVNYWETGDGLEGVWAYNTDLFELTTIKRIGEHFHTLVTAIVANPELPIAQLPLLNPAQLDQVAIEWNDTQVEYPHDKCIHQLFEQQVELSPDAVAVIFDHQQLTYQELNTRANQLAHHLISVGVGADVLVGICVERSIDMIVGLLGILKAGGAYVPLDPEYPTERLQFMLDDARISVLLTQQRLIPKLPAHQAQLICLDTDWQSINPEHQDAINSTVSAVDPAYVIYTSGSTGTPKGVVVNHQSVNRLVKNTNYIELRSDDRIAQAANMAFDAATFEIWGALLNGAKLIVIPTSVLLSPQEFAVSLREHQIDILFLTTALFNQLANLVPQAFMTLRCLLFGGEAVDPKWVQTVLANGAPQQLIHVYGPTENTTFSSWYLVEDLPAIATTIPIGRPISNTQIYILDSQLQPIPVGVPGELHIGGDGLARGYLNRAELTQQKFIPHPFSTDPNSRLYKTGDLARYLPDGNIEYLGRIDNQVKIRGFRIELGEIETVLSQHPDVQTACVIAREDIPGEKQLVAYLVPQPAATPTATALRQFLVDKLPGYMVPKAFSILPSLPLTPNGKVDRRALIAPTYNLDPDTFVEPRNQLELQLVQIWSHILKLDKVGVTDNFFDLGGHSLLAPYLMAEIKQQFTKDLPLATLFQNPTIEQLAITVQQDSSYASSSCLVPIQPHGSKPPFFCLPGAGGRPFYFYHLGRYLGADQPLYSFQNDSSGDLPPVTRIEDMARNYIQAMQTIQPQGPYFLGGHSYGGNIAFEMAQQLVQQGQVVALLVVIDASATTYQDKKLLVDYLDWDDAMWLKEVSKGMEVYLEKNMDISYDTLQSLPIESQMQSVLAYFKTVNILPPDADITQIKQMVQVYKTNTLSLVDYVANQIYPAKITLIRANEQLAGDPNSDLVVGQPADSDLGWGEFSTEAVEIQFVLGNHVTIMSEPHVQVLAATLTDCLQRSLVHINRGN